jgi:tetratricopeptide (TPR) repeat protein
MSLTYGRCCGKVEGMDGNTAYVPSLATDELARRLTELARAGQMNSTDWQAVQDELARRRVEQARRTAAPSGKSLRSQILTLLAEAKESTPSEVATTLNRSTTVVSRVLTTLLESELVAFESDPNDGRIRHYRLSTSDAVSEEGEVKPPSAAEEERQYLRLVIAAAVSARRSTNDLGYAVDRLERALEQATEVEANDLALIARRELVTTLRQAGRDAEVQPHLDALAEIAAGKVGVEADLVAPATACLDYELGRHDPLPTRQRLDHLTTAATVFARCDQLDEAHDWAPREGWALLGSAELWRQQTNFGAAFDYAKRAESVFAAYGDTYGSAEATRMQGLCQRLRGNFSEAIAVLRRADDLAKVDSADRCRADVLLQLGDALRCTGELTAAAETLSEAAEIAGEIGRTRTFGFSLTALAAVRYASGELDQAWDYATKAEQQLASSPPGRALNARRQAVIARELAANGDPTKWDQSVDFFRQSMAQYRTLQSPAGIAACLVGLGKVYEKQGVPDPAIDDLVDVASSRAGRILIPIDPWIPNLMQQWAEESGDPNVHRVADWTYRSDEQPQSAAADEMAGEPRQESQLFTV